MRTFILDTNVVLRFLLADDPKQSPKSKALFELAEKGKIKLVLSPVILAELVWTLHSFFEFPRQEIATKLRGLLLHDGIALAELEIALRALDSFGRVNVDFPDCYAAALASANGYPVTSYDRDFRKFPDIECQLPEEILADPQAT